MTEVTLLHSPQGRKGKADADAVRRAKYGLVTVDDFLKSLGRAPGQVEAGADRFANARRVQADQVAAWIGQYGRLLPRHAVLLWASAIALEVAAARGYRSVTTRAAATRLGFSEAQARVPALLLPVHDVTGEVRTHQIRPDEPRLVRGKAVKYETPAGSTMALDVPPAVRAKLGDPRVPLVITEGIRKADAAVSAGLACIAILGVFNWRGKNDCGGKTALPDWEYIALNGRRIFVCFDSDVGVKPEVHTALERLKKFLELRDARVRIIRLPPGENGSKTGLDDYLAAGHTAEELLALASPDLPAAAEPRSASATTRGPYFTDAKKSQAQRLVEFVADGALFRSTDGETAFATIPVGDHHETWPVRSKGLRRWLIGRFYLVENKPPAAQALSDALGTLEAKAQFGGPVHDVHVRLAGAGEAVYLDLANRRWEAVEVTGAGWRVITDPPVKFRRAKGMLPLPRPVAGGRLAALRQFVNVRDDAQWALLIAWALAALRPSGPYPVLNLTSEHGSGKTTTGEVLRRLIDPNSAMLRATPRDVRDVMIAATNSWMVAFDNLSGLPPWLSDCLCRLSTGGGFSTRELYTDGDEMIFAAQRPALLNGIEEVITRGDLLDRALLLDLPPISEDRRRAVKEFWQAFDAARPWLLGALLDAVSTAVRRERLVRLARLPRMADFALWATAAEPALGWPEGYFVSVYEANREEANEVALDASPVAGGIRALVAKGDWTGTAGELLKVLGELADEVTRKARSWPATPRYLAGVLRLLAPNLRSVGVEVEFAREARATRRRLITIKKVTVLSDQTVHTVQKDETANPWGMDGPKGPSSTVDDGPCRPSTSSPASDKGMDDVDQVDGVAPVLSDDEEEAAL